MRDYLEELLALAQQEGEERPPELLAGYGALTVSLPPEQKQQEKQQGRTLSAEQETETDAVSGSGMLSGAVKGSTALAEGEETAVRVLQSWSEDAAAPLQAQLRERVAAARLYRGVNRLEQAAGYRLRTEPGAQVWSALRREDRSGTVRPAQADARQVDRVFERDARRYDGRFTLF